MPTIFAMWWALTVPGVPGAPVATEAGDTLQSAPVEGTAAQAPGEDIRFSGLFQAWYLDGDGVSPRSFRLRRAMIKATGHLSESAHWTLSVDPAKALKMRNSYAVVGNTRTVSETSPNQASLMLQDAYLSLQMDRVRVDVGQFRIPLGYEGSVMSSSRLQTIERSLFASAGKMTQVRDMGAAARVDLPAGVGVTVGVFNGLGEDQNKTDTDAAKAVVGRFSYRPVDWLGLGVSGAWGGERGSAVARRRLGAEVVLEKGPVTARGELFRAMDGPVQRMGYYGLAAYRVGRWEGVVRYDAWRPDLDAPARSGLGIEDYLLGGSYYFMASPMVLKVNYVRRELDGPGGTNLLLMGLQAAW